jgi:hypothetical protein
VPLALPAIRSRPFALKVAASDPCFALSKALLSAEYDRFVT